MIQDSILYSDGALSERAANQKVWILDPDTEFSLYTWFSTFNLLFAASMLFFAGIEKWKSKQSFSIHVFLLSLIFLALAFDEALSFHEKISGTVKSLFNASGVFYFAWVIPALALLLIGLILYLPFIWSLTPRIRYPMMLSAFIFLSGAVGMEMLAGPYVAQHGVETLTYRLMANLEETLEGLGIAVFIWSILSMRQELHRKQVSLPTSLSAQACSPSKLSVGTEAKPI